MNRWNCISPWLLAMAAALFDCAGSVGVSLGCRREDDSTVGETIEPYTGPPIFLDEPEPPPPASLVEKRVDSDKYADGKIRVERQIARYSDNHFVADGFYREFYPNGEKFAEGQYKNGRQDGDLDLLVRQRQGLPQSDVQERPAGRQLGRTQCRWRRRREAELQERQTRWHLGRLRRDRQAVAPRGAIRGRQGRRHVEGLVPLRPTSNTDGLQARQPPRCRPSWDEKGNKRAELNYVDGKLDGTATLGVPTGRKLSNSTTTASSSRKRRNSVANPSPAQAIGRGAISARHASVPRRPAD